MEQLTLGDITVDVVLKNIKNVHLSVYPPTGRVRIAAPLRMNLDTVRIYVISKLGWIRKQQGKFRAQPRETPREYLNRERHYFMGKRYLLTIIEQDTPPSVRLCHSTIELYVKPNTDSAKRQAILNKWYRAQLKELTQPIVQKWESIVGVSTSEVCIKRMKTKWGTCNCEAKRIWLNLELAKKPLNCIEYIIVHELVHLLERTHNDRFIAHMNRLLPDWKQLRNDLNNLPVSHWDWEY